MASLAANDPSKLYMPLEGVSAQKYDLNPDNEALDKTSILQNAVNVAASSNLPLVFPPNKTFRVSSPIDMRAHGLTVVGNGCTILVTGTNMPGILVGGTLQRIDGLAVEYATTPDQAHDDSNAWVFYSAFLSTFTNLQALNTGRGLYLAQDTHFGDGQNTIFSCVFSNIHINGYKLSAINWFTFPSGGASSTGNILENFYIHNNYPGSVQECFEAPISLGDHDEGHWSQINIEHVSIDDGAAMFMQRVRNLVIDSIHFEGVTLELNNGFIRAFDQTGLDITGMHFTFCNITASAGVKSIFLVGFTGTIDTIHVGTIRLRDFDTTGVTDFAVVELFDGIDANITIDNLIGEDQLVGPWVVNDNYPSPQVKKVGTRNFEKRRFEAADLGFRSESFDGRIMSGTGSAPTAGTVFVTRLKVPEFIPAGTVINVRKYVVVAGTGATALANCFIGLARADTSARIGISADQSASWASVGPKTIAVTLAADKPEGEDLLVCMLVGTQSTTQVTFGRAVTVTASAVINGANTTELKHASADTGQTSIPATIGAQTGSATAYWCAVF